jgi:hypothetical protein
MADPLSIQNAIYGLVEAPSQLSRFFRKVMIDAPATASSALIELNAFSTAITAIQGLIANLEAAAEERRSLIELF